MDRTYVRGKMRGGWRHLMSFPLLFSPLLFKWEVSVSTWRIAFGGAFPSQCPPLSTICQAAPCKINILDFHLPGWNACNKEEWGGWIRVGSPHWAMVLFPNFPACGGPKESSLGCRPFLDCESNDVVTRSQNWTHFVVVKIRPAYSPGANFRGYLKKNKYFQLFQAAVEMLRLCLDIEEALMTSKDICSSAILNNVLWFWLSKKLLNRAVLENKWTVQLLMC